MHRSCLFATAMAALLSSACTHLDTTRDHSTADLNEAVTGIPYALPAIQYKLAVSRAVASCPETLTFEVGGQRVEFSDAAFAFATKVEPTPEYVPGERFVADYTALASVLKTTSYSLETYPNGILKSVNVAAEDQSGPVIKDVVSTALSVAGLFGGAPATLASVASLGGTKGTFESTQYAGKIDWIDLTPRSRKLDAALAQLATKREPIRTVVCKAPAAKKAVARAKAGDDKEAATSALKKATADVMRMTKITASKRASHDDLVRLDAALAEQDRQQALLDAAIAAEAENAGALTATKEHLWRGFNASSETATSYPIEIDLNSRMKLEGLVEIKEISTISRSAFGKWWQNNPGIHDEFRVRLNDLAKHFGVEKNDEVDISPDGSRLTCAASATKLFDCLADHGKLTASIRLVPDGMPVVAASTSRSKSANRGLFIRSQRKADFMLCKGDTPECTGRDRLVYKTDVSAPQFGQLRYLPFSNRIFEASQLSLAMRDDGSVEKFEYKGTKAAAVGAAAAAKDAVDQYSAFRDKEDKHHTDALAAARAEQVAEIQQQITMLNKQSELVKAEAALQPDTLQAVKNETAGIDAQVALLNAKLSQLKAEAALQQASSDGE